MGLSVPEGGLRIGTGRAAVDRPPCDGGEGAEDRVFGLSDDALMSWEITIPSSQTRTVRPERLAVSPRP